jgi:hypothetical protein
MGIEPMTSSLGSWRSTAELLPLKYKLKIPPLIAKTAQGQDFASGLPASLALRLTPAQPTAPSPVAVARDSGFRRAAQTPRKRLKFYR